MSINNNKEPQMKRPPGQWMDIDGQSVYYEQAGRGDHVVLMIPGGVGSVRIDFPHQMDGPTAFDHDQFTLVSFDQPGYGYSRPPERDYCADMLEKDAKISARLMQKLGFLQYSVIGFCESAKVAVHLAAMYPSRVTKMVLIGAAFVTDEDLADRMRASIDTSQWPEEGMDTYYQVYGSDYQQYWTRSMTWYDQNRIQFPLQLLEKIQCPVLICRGDRDPSVSLDQTKFLIEKLADARFTPIQMAAHDLQITHPAEFKAACQPFLLDD